MKSRKLQFRRYGKQDRKGCKKIICKCPKCERDHEVEIFWTGRGKPKIFCLDCTRNVDYKYDIPNQDHKISDIETKNGTTYKYKETDNISDMKLL